MINIPASTPADPDALDLAAREALESMSPKERLTYQLARAQLKATEEQNRILASGERRDQNADAAVRERIRTADEHMSALGAGRRAARVRLEVSFTLEHVQNLPMATIAVTALGHVAGPSEEHAGDMMLSQLTAWDFGDTERALETDCLAPVQDQVAEALAAGQPMVAEQLRATRLGKGAEGFLHRRYNEMQRPAMTRLLTRKPLSALIASGVARQIGEIEVSDTPIVPLHA